MEPHGIPARIHILKDRWKSTKLEQTHNVILILKSLHSISMFIGDPYHIQRFVSIPRSRPTPTLCPSKRCSCSYCHCHTNAGANGILCLFLHQLHRRPGRMRHDCPLPKPVYLLILLRPRITHDHCRQTFLRSVISRVIYRRAPCPLSLRQPPALNIGPVAFFLHGRHINAHVIVLTWIFSITGGRRTQVGKRPLQIIGMCVFVRWFLFPYLPSAGWTWGRGDEEQLARVWCLEVAIGGVFAEDGGRFAEIASYPIVEWMIACFRAVRIGR